MAQHLLKAPDTISATATIQKVTLPETECWYTIRNAGTGSVYFIAQPEDAITASDFNSATAAALRTLGCGMVKSGEVNAFYTDQTHIYIVCANTVTATVNIEPGKLGPAINVEANLGNVGLLDTSETEIDPATKGEQQILTSAPVVKIPLQVTKALAGSPAPIAIVAAETFATAVYLQAARANGDNTGDIFIGLADVVSGTDNYIKLTPGSTWQYVCRAGTKVDLQVFLIDGETATDGVQGYYEPV